MCSTVKGALESIPSFMSSEVTPTEQEGFLGSLSDVRDLIRHNGLALAGDDRL